VTAACTSDIENIDYALQNATGTISKAVSDCDENRHIACYLDVAHVTQAVAAVSKDVAAAVKDC
jgi:hypothetical protein